MNKAEKIYQIKPWSEVDISNDLMFMLVMSDKKRCKRLLNILLGIKVKRFKRIVTQKTLVHNIKNKGIRLDICVETADAIYDIEMQTINSGRAELGKRVRYYQSEIDGNDLRKGKHYRMLRKSVIIFICTFDPFGRNLFKYTFSNLCHEDHSIDLKDDALKVFFYVNGDMANATPSQRRFAAYVRGEAAKDTFTKDIHEAVERYRGNGEQEAVYMSLEQMLMDRADDARREEKKLTLINVIKNMMKNLDCTAEKAMEVLEIPLAERKNYLTLL